MSFGTQYPPVVASGTDALTIHYGRNDKLLADGDLLLMDAGCELHGCAQSRCRKPYRGEHHHALRCDRTIMVIGRQRALSYL